MFKPIRNKADRAKLDGWDCDLCREVIIALFYFCTLNLSVIILLSHQYYRGLEDDMHPHELQRLKNNCSRHRSTRPINQSDTPPGK